MMPAKPSADLSYGIASESLPGRRRSSNLTFSGGVYQSSGPSLDSNMDSSIRYSILTQYP